MATIKKSTAKKAKKVSMLDAAIIGASTPTMGKPETKNLATKKVKKIKKVSMLDAAIIGARTPTMGKLETRKKKK